MTDGEEAELPEPLSHSYETAVSGPSAGVHGAIGHSGVTDGSEDAHPMARRMHTRTKALAVTKQLLQNPRLSLRIPPVTRQ